MEPEFVSADEFVASIQHRYLPDELFSTISQKSGLGTIVGLEPILEQPVLCEVLASAIPQIDRVLREQNVTEPVYLAFTGGSSAIAQAIKVGAVYCICIDYSLIDICLKLSTLTYWSDIYINRSVFSLKEPMRDPRWLASTGRYFSSIRNVDVEGSVTCQEDLLHITSISRIVLSGIITHELTHIINGHLAYLDQCREEDPSFKLDGLTSHTLEFDADASFILAYLYEINELGPFKISPKHDKKFVFSNSSMAAIFYGILAFKLLEFLDKGQFDPVSSSHLPTGVRSRHAFGTIMTLLMKTSEETGTNPDIDYIGTQIIEVINMVEGIFYLASDNRLSPFRLTDENGQFEYDAVTEAVRRRWLTLQPQLMRCKIGSGNLAPAVMD